MKKQELGSIKNKIVATDLLEERAKCNFNMNEMALLLYGGKEELDIVKGWVSEMEGDSILRNNEKWYEMTREEQMIVNM